MSTNPTCRSDYRRLACNHSLVLIPQVSALSVIARSLAVKNSPSSASVSAQNFAALLLAVAVTTLILKKNVCSLCHHRAFLGSESYRQIWRQSLFKISRCVCRCIAYCPFFAPCPCYCSHDPFIVRSAQTCTPFTGSVSMFTINVDNFLFQFSCFRDHVGSLCLYRVSVFISGLQLRHQIHHRLVNLHLAVECGVHGQ